MATIKPEQLDFLDWEFGVFFHFGIRTFCQGRRDWDGVDMPLSAFDPAELDCGEWIEAVRDAGAKYAVLVCKHHDGFANWPSACTDYSVKNTPWKNGRGDVVREFTDACRKYGVKVGLYYSPAQYGSVQMDAKAYDDYFIRQIRELLTGYGKIDYLWFDGCGSEGHRYDTERIVSSIRACQPHILLFNMWDPDTRWIGNESGVADSPNRLFAGEPDAVRFLPAECDCRIRKENWFWDDADAHTVKSLDELMGLYDLSVGRGANLLLNVGPDRRGKLPAADKAALLAFGQAIRERFAHPLDCTARQEGGTLTLAMTPQLVNHIVLSEEITEDEIGLFEICAHPHPYGAPVCVYRGMTVGHKAICTFPTIRTGKLEIRADKEKRLSAQVHYVSRYGK